MANETIYGSKDERDAALDADRQTADAPLPYADLRHYTNETQRQVDLAAAERSNIAKAAGELGLTSAEYQGLRAKLGRSPTRGDVSPPDLR